MVEKQKTKKKPSDSFIFTIFRVLLEWKLKQQRSLWAFVFVQLELYNELQSNKYT